MALLGHNELNWNHARLYPGCTERWSRIYEMICSARFGPVHHCSWRRHDVETLSVITGVCEGICLGGFPSQRFINVRLWRFLWYQVRHVGEQTVGWPVIHLDVQWTTLIGWWVSRWLFGMDFMPCTTITHLAIGGNKKSHDDLGMISLMHKIIWPKCKWVD